MNEYDTMTANAVKSDTLTDKAERVAERLRICRERAANLGRKLMPPQPPAPGGPEEAKRATPNLVLALEEAGSLAEQLVQMLGNLEQRA